VGAYRIQFVVTLAVGQVLIAPNVGDDATDSDVDPGTGVTVDLITVVGGEMAVDVNAIFMENSILDSVDTWDCDVHPYPIQILLQSTDMFYSVAELDVLKGSTCPPPLFSP
jgi:hypothetical protein